MPKPEFPAEKNKQTKGKGGAFRSGAFSVETFLKVLLKEGCHVGGLVLKAGEAYRSGEVRENFRCHN
jgi:hypothetical protein